MRNPSMLRLGALLLGFSCLLPWGLSGEEGFHPTVEVGVSYLQGTVYELVLRDGTYDDPISRLTWPVPPSGLLEIKAGLPWTGWTTTSMALSGLTPGVVGTMIDEDWRIGTMTYGRSTHDAYLTAHWSARLDQSFHWGPLSASVGGLYRWMTWEGWNGTGRYTDTTGDTDEVTFTGLIIAYRQQWFIPYVGTSLRIDGPGWTLTPAFRFSPATWCFDMDNHKYARTDSRTYDDKDFLDQTRGGIYLQGDLEVAFRGGEDWEWGVRGGGEIAWGAIGDTITTFSYQSSSGNTILFPTDEDMAGTWFREASFTVFVRN